VPRSLPPVARGWDREISGCRNLALLANVDLIFEKVLAGARAGDGDGWIPRIFRRPLDVAFVI